MAVAQSRAEGVFRIVHLDANDIALGTLLEKRTEEFPGTVTAATAKNPTYAENQDPQPMPKVKATRVSQQEDDKLALYYKPDAAITKLFAFLRIPVRYKNTRTGGVYEKTLNADEFVQSEAKMGNSVQDGVAVTALDWALMGYYEVPAQTEIRLGHKLQDVRVDSALEVIICDETSSV